MIAISGGFPGEVFVVTTQQLICALVGARVAIAIVSVAKVPACIHTHSSGNCLN